MTGLTDSTGNLIQKYEYDSFGNITFIQNPSFKQPYTYTAREYDEETGLYYYRARYYDAKVGRFISDDPIGLEGGDVNLFRYVGNNPINQVDPEGLKVQICYSPIESWLAQVGGEHASINANCGIWGFYPKDKKVLNSVWGLGKISDDSNRGGLRCIDPEMTKCVNEECVCRKIKASKANPGLYSVILYNCHSWVRQVILECQKM